jgi:hypothetical protein
MNLPEDFGSEDPPSHSSVRRVLDASARILLTLVGIASLTLAAGSILLTQTIVGRGAVASFVEDELDGSVNGDVDIGPILGGNLLTSVLLDRFVIRDSAGEEFVALDSVRMEYNPLSMLSGTYRFRSVTASRAKLLLHQGADGVWNYDRIFEGDDDSGPSTTRVLLTDLAVREGTVEIRTPWGANLSGAALAARVREGLSGEALWRVEESESNGFERVIRLDSLSGLFPVARIVDPVRPMRIEMESLRAQAAIVTQTLDIERFNGVATFRDSIEIQIDRLETSTSSLQGDGWVLTSSPVAFAFDLEADPLGFEDLQWLPIPLPTRGGGPADLLLHTRPDGVIVTEITNGDIRVDDSHITGDFDLHLEDPPRFASFNLDLRPMRLAMLDEILARESLMDGFVSGPLRGRGPITLLNLTADLELRDLPSDDSIPPSHLGVNGEISMVVPRLMRALSLDMRGMEPRWTRAVGIESHFGGRAIGGLTIDGTAGGRIAFALDTDHHESDGSLSSVTGDGTIDLSTPGQSMLDVRFDFQPLAVRAVRPLLPEIELVGEVRGPMSAQGRLNDLRVVADLRTPRGLLNFDGQFDLESEARTYDARLLARDLQLSQWIDEGPETSLAVEGRVVGVGTDPATLRARFDLVILPSLFEGARVDTSLIRFTLSEGLAVADTFAVRTSVGEVEGRGSFGLTSETSGSLILDVDLPDLTTWNDWFVPGRNPARNSDDVSDLFAAFDVSDEQPQNGRVEPAAPAPDPPDTIAGRATALGVLYGNVESFSFGGRVNANSFEYGGNEADSLQLTVDVPDPRDLGTVTIRIEAERSTVLGVFLDRFRVRWERLDAALSNLELSATRDTTIFLASKSALDWTEESKHVRIDEFDVRLGERRLTLADTATVTYGRHGFSAGDVTLTGDGGALLQLDGVVPDSGPAHMDVAARGIRLENVLQLVGNPRDLTGEFTFGASVRGTADAPLWDAHLDISDPSIEGISYDGLAADLSYSGRRLAVAMAVSSRGLELGRLDGFLRTDLSMRQVDRRLLDDPISLTVLVDSMPLDALGIGFSTIRDVSGYARGRVRVTGEPTALLFDGDTQIHQTEMFVPGLGIRLEGIEGRVEFDGTSARIDTLSIRSSAGGSADVKGTMSLETVSDIGLDLDLSARGFRGLDRRTASMRLDGQGKLAGSYQNPKLTGRFRLSEGDIRTERFLRQRQAVDLSDPAIYALIDTTAVMEQRLFETTRNPFLQNLLMETQFDVGPALWLRSEGLEVELSGELDVRMNRQTGELVAFGTVLLPRGSFRYSFGSSTDISSLLSRNLQISRGAVTFVGSPGMDPNLDIDAIFRTRSDLGPLEVGVHIGGTSLAPTMTTSSTPPLPEPERICYLLFSSPCIGAGAEGGEFAASIVREGLLGQVGTQFSQVLVEGVGLVDYLDIRSSGSANTGLGGGASRSLLYGTEVEIGRYLTPDVFVRATQPLGGFLPGAALEWSFLPDWRLEFSTEDRARRYSAYGNSLDVFSNRTWGLMLFRQWDF